MYKVFFDDISQEDKEKIKHSCVKIIKEGHSYLKVILTDLGQLDPFCNYNTKVKLYTPQEAEEYLDKNREDIIPVRGFYFGIPYRSAVSFIDWSELGEGSKVSVYDVKRII